VNFLFLRRRDLREKNHLQEQCGPDDPRDFPTLPRAGAPTRRIPWTCFLWACAGCSSENILHHSGRGNVFSTLRRFLKGESEKAIRSFNPDEDAGFVHNPALSLEKTLQKQYDRGESIC
jgi:hypothetical protein